MSGPGGAQDLAHDMAQGGPRVELRIWRVEQVVPALLRMAAGPRRLRHVPGLRFAKLLGTGSGQTFTPRDADLRHWALLSVWDGDRAARAGADHPMVAAWDDAASERLTVRMRPLASRGRWAGQEPFGVPVPATWDGPVAAITRARLRPTRALSFWHAVPPVVDEMHRTTGLRLAIGVGEAPIGLQGTFSLWDSSRSLVDFAYRSPTHRAAVARTGPERWYAEELFARLAVDDIVGTYRGRTP